MHQPITETPSPIYHAPPSFAQRLIRRMINILILIILLWGAAITYIWFQQEKLLFYPEPLNPDFKFNLAYTSEVYIDVPGAKLHALYLHQPPEKTKGIVLFLHGNAGNLETWFTHADFWLTTGFDVLMPDYRGFGKSTGHIDSEAQLHDDVMHMWKFVAANYPNKKVVFYGRSLGTGLAAKLATEVPADLVILVSPYQSMMQMGREYYPWVPSFILRYPLKTNEFLPHINVPILLLHGTQDKLISIEHSRRLLTLNPHARLVEIDGAGHNDIHNFDVYTDTLKKMLHDL
ncbi:MAG: alpha/beta fold hydrolase [Moraxellaceae bacterium]|nr:MAG: alpha/beta fold hydrolase [Moraxellaceae bacterium]